MSQGGHDAQLNEPASRDLALPPTLLGHMWGLISVLVSLPAYKL